MPYTNDMATLAQVVSPVDAAMQAGQEQGNQNLQDAVKTNIAQQTMPQEIQKASLLNQMYQAQAQNEQGVALQNQAKGLSAMQTQPSDVAAQIGGNQAKLSTDQVTKMGNLGQIVGQVAQYMQNVPAPARPAMMQQILDSQGVSDPGLRQAVASGDPALLQQISNGLIQHSAGYQTESMKESESTARSLGVAKIGADARVTAAETTANARLQVAETVKQMREQQQTFEQAAVRLQSTNPQLAQQYANAALQLKQAQAGITSQLIQGQALQMPDIQGQSGMPPPAAAGAQPGMPAGARPLSTGGFDPSAAAAEAKRRGLIK